MIQKLLECGSNVQYSGRAMAVAVVFSEIKAIEVKFQFISKVDNLTKIESVFNMTQLP